MMKSSDEKGEFYLFNQILKEFFSHVEEMWYGKEELEGKYEEDAKYAQAMFRGEIESYLRGKHFFKQIREWIYELYQRDRSIDWSKDKQKFLALMQLYENYVDQFRKIKLGSAKERYDGVTK